MTFFFSRNTDLKKRKKRKSIRNYIRLPAFPFATDFLRNIYVLSIPFVIKNQKQYKKCMRLCVVRCVYDVRACNARARVVIPYFFLLHFLFLVFILLIFNRGSERNREKTRNPLFARQPKLKKVHNYIKLMFSKWIKYSTIYFTVPSFLLFHSPSRSFFLSASVCLLHFSISSMYTSSFWCIFSILANR